MVAEYRRTKVYKDKCKEFYIKINLKQLKDTTTFLMDIYLEKKEDSKMIFNFLDKNQKIVAKFEANLNFLGWQCILVPLKDMKILKKTEIVKLKIELSDKIKFYYTIPEIVDFDVRYPTPDYCLPFVNLRTYKSVNKNWTALLMYDNILEKYFANTKKCQIDNLENLIKKFCEINKGQKKSKKELIEKFESFDLEKGYLYSHYFSEDSIDIREFGKLMFDISNNLEGLEDKYIKMFNFLYLQGFRKGSNFVTADHLGYRIREIFTSFIFARKLLEKNNLLKKAIGMLSWFSGLGRIVDAKVKEVNIDILNTQLQPKFITILLLDDNTLLNHFKNWINLNILSSFGLLGGFKKDGSMFHHCQHYIAYGVDGLKSLLPIVYVLKDSKYQISSKANNKLQMVLKRFKIYTQGSYIPISLSGRHPDKSYEINEDIYNYLDIKFREKDYLFSMNYAGMLVKRTKKGTLFIARGFSRYLVGNESYLNKNMYGRYALYGRYEIVPKNIEKQGYDFNKFNFSHFNGTTSFKKSKKELKSRLSILPCAGYEEMLLSTEKFLASNTLDKVGVFAMKLKGHSKYNEQDLKANKSYFVLNNHIVCVGSEINKNAITTVFQNFHFKGKKIEKEIKIFDTRYILDENSEYIKEKDIVYISHKKNQKYKFDILLDNSKKEKYKILSDNVYHAIVYKNYTAYVFFKREKNLLNSFINSVSLPSVIIVKKMKGKLKLSVINSDLNLYSGVEDDQVENGVQKEVSIYSRKWIGENPKSQNVEIILNGVFEVNNKNIKISVLENKTTINLKINGYKEKNIILYEKTN